MARHANGTITLVLAMLVATGCQNGADRRPLRLDSLLSRRTGNDAQASAEVNTPSLPFSRSADSPNHASTTGDYRVPQPFSATESAMAGVRGKFYQTAGSIKDAVTLHPKVIAAKDPTSLDFDPGPLHPDLYVSAAAVLEQQHRTAEAAGKYQQALELDPHHRSALIGLARLRHREGDAAGAIQVYQDALQAYPDDAVLLNDLGLCYARAGQTDLALTALQKAVELNPNSTLYRNNMAAVLVEANRSAEAVPLLAQAYGTAVAYYNVGYLLHQRGADHAAVEHFVAALEANPSLTPARSMLNQLAPQLGERPARPSSPDPSRLPSAAVSPTSPLPEGPVAGNTGSLRTSPAAWTGSANDANASHIVRSLATDVSVSIGQASPASHVTAVQSLPSSLEPSNSPLEGPGAPNLLRRPITGAELSTSGELVPPVPQPLARPVRAEFLPLPDPPQPE